MRPSIRCTVPIGTTANLSIFNSVASSPDFARRAFSSSKSPTVSARGASLGWKVLPGGKSSPVAEISICVPMTAEIGWRPRELDQAPDAGFVFGPVIDVQAARIERIASQEPPCLLVVHRETFFLVPKDRYDDESAAAQIKGGLSLGPLRKTELLSHSLCGGLNQGDPRLALELRIASGVVSVAVGMRDENPQLFPGGPLPLIDQVANDAIERKAVCFGSGAGVLDENGVIPDEDINEGSFKMDALALAQHVGRCVERKDIDGRIGIAGAIL